MKALPVPVLVTFNFLLTHPPTNSLHSPIRHKSHDLRVPGRSHKIEADVREHIPHRL